LRKGGYLSHSREERFDGRNCNCSDPIVPKSKEKEDKDRKAEIQPFRERTLSFRIKSALGGNRTRGLALKRNINISEEQVWAMMEKNGLFFKVLRMVGHFSLKTWNRVD
jgi:hypothetical protein